MLIVCIDYSGNSTKMYGLIAIEEHNLKKIAKFYSLFPHYSDIKTKYQKTKILKRFNKRYIKVKDYIETMEASENFNDIINILTNIKDKIKIVYVDIHIYKRVKEILNDKKIINENKRKLKKDQTGVYIAFNIIDLYMHYMKKYKKKGDKERSN